MLEQLDGDWTPVQLEYVWGKGSTLTLQRPGSPLLDAYEMRPTGQIQQATARGDLVLVIPKPTSWLKRWLLGLIR